MEDYKALLENLEQFRKYLDERRFYHHCRCDIFAGSELFAISQKFNSLFVTEDYAERDRLRAKYQSVVPDSTKGEKRMSKEWKETEYRMTEQAYIRITKRKEELMSKNPKLTRDEAVKLAIHQLLKEGL